MNEFSPETEATYDLLMQILQSFTDHHQALELNAKEMPSRVEWFLKCHADDMGKVCGRQGAHIQALQYLVRQIGMKQDAQHVLELMDPEPAPRRDRTPPKQADAYDPRPALGLLEDVLRGTLLGQFTVELTMLVTPHARPLTYVFQIHARDDDDQSKLLEPAANNPNRTTLIGAIGTLWRAYANKDGVVFKIECKSR